VIVEPFQQPYGGKMLQQPVAKELRSFKSLSKFSQKRSGLIVLN
jgi:hypothetical protein